MAGIDLDVAAVGIDVVDARLPLHHFVTLAVDCGQRHTDWNPLAPFDGSWLASRSEGRHWPGAQAMVGQTSFEEGG